MLSTFDQPKTIICVLCRGTVSIRNDDRTRFYNHISLDHEVHYEHELFFALSTMEAKERETVVNVLNNRLDGVDESSINDVTLDESIVGHSSIDEQNEAKTEKQQKEKDQVKEAPPGTKTCPFCNRTMAKGSFTRHMKRVHQISKDDQIKLDSSDMNIVKKERPDVTSERNEKKSKEIIGKVRTCKLCFKKVKSSTYKKHLNVHTKRKIPCHFCNHNFTRKDNLQSHLKSVHKNDLHLLDEDGNPKFSEEDCKYECNDCSRKFITEESAKYHEGRKHGIGNIRCGQCERKFVSQQKLAKHKKICIVNIMP